MVNHNLQDEGDWFYVACGQGENEDSCDIIHEGISLSGDAKICYATEAYSRQTKQVEVNQVWVLGTYN